MGLYVWLVGHIPAIPLLRDNFDGYGGIRCVGSPGGVEDRFLHVCSCAECPFGGMVLVPLVRACCAADVGVGGRVDGDVRHGDWSELTGWFEWTGYKVGR